MARVVDVARYQVDPVMGYIPQASQSGDFLRRAPFAFNERHMGVARPFRPGRRDVLLVGDSVVIGSNWIPQRERLGAALERRLGRRVWPIAANSWGLSNELALLASQPDLMRLRTLILVSNEGDFGPPSVWRGAPGLLDRTTPSVTWFLAAPHLGFGAPPPLRAATREAATRWQRQLAGFLKAYRGCLVWVYYPNTDNLDYRLPAFAALDRRIRGRAHRILVRGNGWNAALYRDAIHPTAAGNAALARIIADAMRGIAAAPGCAAR